MADAVLQWVGDAQAAERETGVPADVLLGLISVESGGREGLTSSAAAGGLTQFIHATAVKYHVDVRPGHAASQIRGAAHYLIDLGFHDNPELALAKYNAGPGNPGAAGDYPKKVLAAAKRYVGAKAGTSPGRRSSPPADDGQATPPSDSGGGLFDALGDNALKSLVWVATIGAGVVIAGLGVSRMVGVRNPLGQLGAAA